MSALMWQAVKQKFSQWRGILMIAPGIAGLVIVGSYFGLFSLFEWVIADQLLRLRPSEPIDQRVVIVTIDEPDIRYVKDWPMSDRLMAKLLSNILTQQPKAIGIDIYRDLVVEPGHQDLVSVFQSHPTIIGVEKVAGSPVGPSPTLAKLGQVAANDFVLDRDGKVRRGLVIIGKKDGTLQEGLATKLAQMYLEDRKITLQAINPNQQIYGLGKAVFVPLTGQEGEYSKAETGGYQILLNYRGELSSFPHISMTEVLEGRIPPGLMKDRIVLIGAIAPSLNDLFQTPYSNRLFTTGELTPGVVVHANLLSQILSAALEGRPMLQAPKKWVNWVWIFFWSSYSTILGSLWLRTRWVTIWVTIGILAAGVVIVLSAYGVLLVGWSIPVFAPLLTVAVSATVSIGYVLWDNLNLSYEQLEDYAQTLEVKVADRTAELAQANAEITLLNEKLKAENLRMSAELDILREMQQLILPKPAELDSIPGLDIAGFMEPADEVGGDYYDVLSIDGVVTIGIGDVTGHGLESGILMVMTQTAVRTLKEIQEIDPVRFLDVLNRTIYKNLQRMNSDKNLTLSVLNYVDGAVSISGQHEEVIIVRSGGHIERVDTLDLGFPIGLDEDIASFVNQIVIKLNHGDGLVLYTDGITEARNMNKKLYGIHRFCEVISQHWHRSAEDIKQAVIDDVRQYIGAQKVFDDITLLILKNIGLSA